MAQSLDTLMGRLIDYAGLFPPASLSPDACARNYARYRAGSHAAFLGRIIWPASRLDDLTRSASVLMPGTHATSGYREYANIGEPWGVSVVADIPLDDALERINDFNRHHANEDHGLALVDCIEIRAATPADVEKIDARVPDNLFPFIEFPHGEDPRGYIAALAGSPAAAKIRCGGVTSNAFPHPDHVAAFIHACAVSDVPFKATAGLHHAIRGEYRLTYDDDPPRGTMYGFFNVFMAAALARSNEIGRDDIRRILLETDAAAFRFTDECAAWRHLSLTTIELAQARESFALSYGSCSFDEPIEDLTTLGLIRA